MTTGERPLATQATLPQETREAERFKLWQLMRMSTFQIGSAMGDILLAGVWNRILITDFGIPAWPVGLLIALRNFLAPISIWIGHRSDTQPIAGWFRTSYIWFGRLMMVLALPLLGFSTVRLESNSTDPVGWALAAGCFLLYGLGSLTSGSPFLALARDSVPRQKQGIAIGVIETTLIAMFPVAAIGFSRMLESYTPAAFWRLIVTVMVIGGFFWFFAILGVERRRPDVGQREASRIDLRATFGQIWNDRRTRLFFIFLFVATFSAWMQDNIMEPFGGDVFDMAVEQTTRLTSYWGTATILVVLISFYVWRRRNPENQSRIARIGLIIMAVGLFLVAASSLVEQERFFLMSLVVFGTGFGLYTFGGLSLMAAMSPDPHAGAYLGLWTVAVLVSKGLGTFAGGLLRDILLWMGMPETGVYSVAFAAAGVGLLLAVWILTRLDVPGFVRDSAAVQETPAL